MIVLYRVVSYIFYVVVYRWGRIRTYFGDEVWRGRLALIDNASKVDLWIHAASVGEVRVISYLVGHLKKLRPELRIHITTMTRAGHATAKSLFSDGITVSFLPFDVPVLMRRFVDAYQPKVAVIAETEIWPNLIQVLSERKTPIVLVNGRMTERSLRRYLWFRKALSSLLSRYDRCFVKSAGDLDRFIRLGTPVSICEVAGDMKFDAPLPDRSEAKCHGIRESVGVSKEQFLFVAGSTRPGEEEQLAKMYGSLKARFPQLRLVLAPRHIERAGEIVSLLQLQGLKVVQHSQGCVQSEDAVVVVDRMGVLNDLYMASNLAFVGGTLVDIGGHNILEPVWAGVPVLYGPSTANVREAADYIKEHNYGLMVDSAATLESVIARYIRGEIQFHAKTTEDLAHSPTAQAGAHILERLGHA